MFREPVVSIRKQFPIGWRANDELSPCHRSPLKCHQPLLTTPYGRITVSTLTLVGYNVNCLETMPSDDRQARLIDVNAPESIIEGRTTLTELDSLFHKDLSIIPFLPSHFASHVTHLERKKKMRSHFSCLNEHWVRRISWQRTVCWCRSTQMQHPCTTRCLLVDRRGHCTCSILDVRCQLRTIGIPKVSSKKTNYRFFSVTPKV